MNETDVEGLGRLLETPALADALGDRRFKQLLDLLPVGVAVAEILPQEKIVYVNPVFERALGQPSATILGSRWTDLPGRSPFSGVALGEAVSTSTDELGTFKIEGEQPSKSFEAWSHLIEDDGGDPVYRLVALVEDTTQGERAEAFSRDLQEKDALLRELQHRVKNNLQMITTLIRVEARRGQEAAGDGGFDRLAGRIEALALLYKSLSDDQGGDQVDLGIYLSQIASAVMQAHATDGVRLAIQVDAWTVGIDVAMSAGLVVNEIFTNALKHAFHGRDGGTIRLEIIVKDEGCQVMIADDGVGLPDGATWPQEGKMGSLMVRSLRQNAKASFEVSSDRERGTTFRMVFPREGRLPSA